jgi:hypothetical protein
MAGWNALDRYVLPLDQPVPLDRDGFLDVSGTVWWGSDENRPQLADDLAGQSPGFAFLAAGGAGKSFVMDRLSEREPSAVTVDLRTLTGPEMRTAVRAAVACGGPVYLDALEDVANDEPATFGVLERELTTAAARGIRWRLACRPAAWDAGLAAALKSSFPGFRELRLLPLTRPAAEELVASAGVSAGPFLDALIKARLGRLAASPQRLRATALHWAGTGDLPKTHVEAISFEIDRLLAETDRGRPQPSLPADRRRRLAARLGAISAFTGAARFARAAEAVPGLLGVSLLPSEPEPEDPGTRVRPEDYSEVLDTGLFAAAPAASVEFGHQQYAEFLAAEYLVERQVARPQVRALLGVQAAGLVPGPVIAVAAWLAARRPALVEDLIARNALAFAEAGIELPSHDVRAAVVGGLLDAAASGDIDPAPGTDLSSLTHPGLEAQLLAHLGDGPAGPEHLWWIAMLAAAGTCRALTAALLQEADSARWPDWARRASVTALAVLGDDEELVRLRPLLDLGHDEDPDDEVLSAVIGTLYPRLLSTAELLRALRPQRNLSLRGYHDVLSRLADKLPREDLPGALRWAAERVPAVAGDRYGSLLSRLMTRGWAEAGAPDARTALSRLIAALSRDPAGDTWSSRAVPPWAGADPGRRLDLAAAAAAEIGTGRWHALIDFQLIGPADLGWLVSQLPAMPVPAQRALAACIPGLARHPTATQANVILGLPDDHPAYETTRFLRDPVSASSPAARQWQEIRERTVRDEDLREATRAQRAEALAAALDEAVADPAAWWHVAWWLSATDRGHADGDLFTGDLTGRPGWTLLDDQERRQVLDLGVEYLTVHQPRPQEWAGHPKISAPTALPDWSGVYLLSTLARHDPGRVQALDTATWRKWAPAITGAWSSGQERDQRLRGDLIGLAPPAGKQCILDAALDHLDALNEHGGNLPYQVYQHLSADLAESLADRLAAGRYSGQLALALLELLITHAPPVAAPLCRRLHEDDAPELAPAARRGLARLDPSAIVDGLDAAAAGPADLAEVMPHLAVTGLGDDRLAVLARILLRTFPYAQDPPPQFSAFRPDDLYQSRHLRNQVLERLTQHGRTAALEQLALSSGNDADREVIGWYLRRARGRAADLTLARPDPSALLRLLRRSDARLIRRAGDLTEVMITQLQQIQHELTYAGASRDLWNFGDDGAVPGSEDDITDWVRRQLAPRLTIATTIDREVQVERKKPGMGTRIDLAVTAPAVTHPAAAVRVITEAKLVTNDTVKTAMHNQLISRYLIPTGLQHGIYLVYWIPASQRRTRKRTRADPAELLRQLERQAASAGQDIHITPFLLDITHQ